MGIDNIDVSIVIPARNEEQNIGKCLDALTSQQTSFTVEIIIIDSGSDDRTVAVVKHYISLTKNLPIKIILIEIAANEFGHGKTRNLGAQKARGDILVFLNADALPADQDWLQALLENFVNDSQQQVAGVFSRHLPRPGCYLYMKRDIGEMMPGIKMVKSRRKPLDFMIFSTVSCAIRRDVWLQFPFDHDIIIAEDQEWAQRILDNGYQIIYEPQSRVIHSHNYSPGELYAVKYKVGCSERKFKNRFLALTAGFILVCGGFFLKSWGDFFFILGRSEPELGNHEQISNPLGEKLRQVRIALVARATAFWGRYRGWQARNKAERG